MEIRKNIAPITAVICISLMIVVILSSQPVQSQGTIDANREEVISLKDEVSIHEEAVSELSGDVHALECDTIAQLERECHGLSGTKEGCEDYHASAAYYLGEYGRTHQYGCDKALSPMLETNLT